MSSINQPYSNKATTATSHTLATSRQRPKLPRNDDKLSSSKAPANKQLELSRSSAIRHFRPLSLFSLPSLPPTSSIHPPSGILLHHVVRPPPYHSRPPRRPPGPCRSPRFHGLCPHQGHSPRPLLRLWRPRALHLGPDHGAPPLQAPPDLRQRLQRRHRGPRRGSGQGRRKGCRRSGTSYQLPRWWSRQPHSLLGEPRP